MMTRTKSAHFFKLAVAWAALQSVAIFTWINTASADDDTQGALQRSIPDVRRVDSRAELKPHVGIMGGYNNVRGPVNGAAAGTLDVGFQPIIPISVGVQFSHTPTDLSTAGADPDFKVTNALGRLAFNFGGDIPVIQRTYLGVKSGVTWYNVADTTDTHFALGPVLGMDFPLGTAEKITLGPEFTYLGVFGDNAPDQLSAAGALKYWF